MNTIKTNLREMDSFSQWSFVNAMANGHTTFHRREPNPLCIRKSSDSLSGELNSLPRVMSSHGDTAAGA